MSILLVAKTLVANVSHQFRDQFTMETISITKLKTSYNILRLF